MPDPENEACPDCAGTGHLTGYDRDAEGDLTITRDVTCPRCAGTGVPPVAVALHPEDV